MCTCVCVGQGGAMSGPYTLHNSTTSQSRDLTQLRTRRLLTGESPVHVKALYPFKIALWPLPRAPALIATRLVTTLATVQDVYRWWCVCGVAGYALDARCDNVISSLPSSRSQPIRCRQVSLAAVQAVAWSPSRDGSKGALSHNLECLHGFSSSIYRLHPPGHPLLRANENGVSALFNMFTHRFTRIHLIN